MHSHDYGVVPRKIDEEENYVIFYASNVKDENLISTASIFKGGGKKRRKNNKDAFIIQLNTTNIYVVWEICDIKNTAHIMMIMFANEHNERDEAILRSCR
jgi:hypothetical protein